MSQSHHITAHGPDKRKAAPAQYADEPMHISHAMRAVLARYGIDPDEPAETPSPPAPIVAPLIDWPSPWVTDSEVIPW